MKKTLIVLCLVGALTVSAVAELPDTLGEPLAEISLSEYFIPDPHRHEMIAGGNLRFDEEIDLTGNYFRRDGAILVSGWVYGSGPDVTFFYDTSRSQDLHFSFESDGSGDTFLLISAPDGDWWIFDDSAESLDPTFSIINPPSGRYDIWVGTWGPDSVPGELIISEFGDFGVF